MKKTSIYPIVFLSLIFALFVRAFFVSVYKIPTDSMAPMIMAGDYILASQVSYGLHFPWSQEVWFRSKPHKGDLVACYFKSKPSFTYLRRVVAVEGETILNTKGEKIVLGPGQFYVVSDNPEFKEDSNEFGPIEVEQIESKAQLIWFSLSSEKQVRWNRLLKNL